MFAALLLAPVLVLAQGAVDAPQPEDRDKAEREIEKQNEKIAQTSNVEIVGAKSFKEQELRTQLKDQIASIEELGLTAARADDAAFFLELFYRKNGFSKVNVKYVLAGGNRLRLEIDEGPRITMGEVEFVGNSTLPSDKLFEYFVGPTRERYSKMEKKLPYVKSDLDEGIDLVRRLYVSEGFLNVIVQEPHVRERAESVVDTSVAIVEGRRYSFGAVSFDGQHDFQPGQIAQRNRRHSGRALHRSSPGRYSAAIAGLLQGARLLQCESRRDGIARCRDRRPRAGARHDFTGRHLLFRWRERDRIATAATEFHADSVSEV